AALADGSVGVITGIIGTVTGLVALLLSGFSLRRSIKADANAKKATFSQKRLELMSRLNAGEATLISTRSKIMAISDEVVAWKDQPLISRYENYLQTLEGFRDHLEGMRETCGKLAITKKTEYTNDAYDGFIHRLDRLLGEMGWISDPKSIEARAEEFLL